ncbi:MAG: RNHCP domain-containing protein, partial [Myxococcota bacterium]|nr:RNHCP domain-containing protein [Myxococcota bacterium]
MNVEDLSQELSNLRTRGEIKRFAKRLDTQSELRTMLLKLLQNSGHTDLEDYSSKKLIRLYLDRSKDAQIRKNPIFIDEGFVCGHCKRSVPMGDVMIRDHCPFCLWGRHLDNIPGDRAASCGALMKPESFETSAGQTWIHYVCTGCSHRFRVR